jgi:hypothetical protein
MLRLSTALLLVVAVSARAEQAPGKVVAAGFFDERWQLPAEQGK